MKARSDKMVAKYRLRRPLVARLLEERPWCEIRWDENCTGRAVDVDEIQSRAALGSILDEANLQMGCRSCHRMKHDHPEEARERDLTRTSWWKPTGTDGDGGSWSAPSRTPDNRRLDR